MNSSCGCGGGIATRPRQPLELARKKHLADSRLLSDHAMVAMSTASLSGLFLTQVGEKNSSYLLCQRRWWR
eukprot:5171226-Pleurochrysis_carterae.AAC.1